MDNKPLDKEGLTLVELIITVAILGIIISLIFPFLNFNYSSFIRSNNSYNKQIDLNKLIYIIEDELRFVDEIYIYDEIEFDNSKNYIYIEDNNIIIKKANSKSKKLITDNIIINDLVNLESYFSLTNNLITINIKGRHLSNNEEINIKYTMELLNIKGNYDIKGSIIEYSNTKGDDTY